MRASQILGRRERVSKTFLFKLKVTSLIFLLFCYVSDLNKNLRMEKQHNCGLGWGNNHSRLSPPLKVMQTCAWDSCLLVWTLPALVFDAEI